jgi:hypothetical protein
MSIISALGRLRQKDCEFKASLGFIAGPCLRNKTKLPQNKKKEKERQRKKGRKEGRKEKRKKEMG